MKKIILLLIVIALVLFISKVFVKNSSTLPIQSEVTPTVQSGVKTEAIPEANITFSYPEYLLLTKEEQMNLTTNEPYAVTFTLQNYEQSIAEISDPYQLYGIYQWDTEQTTREQFKEADYMLTPESRKEFTIDGQPAISGVAQGERARFTTYILTPDMRVLTLAASESTEAQREITENIISSIRFD